MRMATDMINAHHAFLSYYKHVISKNWAKGLARTLLLVNWNTGTGTTYRWLWTLLGRWWLWTVGERH